MNVPDEELSRWTDVALRVDNLLIAAQDAFRAGEAEEARYRVDDARSRVWRLVKALVRAGVGRTIRARVLRCAAELAEAVDKERGWFPDGPAEIVGDWAEEAEFQAFGPVGLRGME